MTVHAAGRAVIDLGARAGILDAMDRVRSAAGADDLVLSVAAGAPVLRSAVFLEVLRRAAGARRIALVTPDARARSLAASVHVPAFASVAALERHELDATEPLGKARKAAIVAAEPHAPSRGRLVAVVASLLVATLVLLGVVAPTATVVVAPLSQPVGPFEYDLRAGPNGADINALTLQAELSTKFTGTATGSRTDETKATGVEHFSNQTTTDIRIPKGTIVQTSDNIRFLTTEDKVLPHSQIQIFPPSVNFGTVDIAIEATDSGTRGNVDANKITVAPNNAGQYSVTNQKATSGGDSKKIMIVQLADYDLARSRVDGELKTKADAQVDTWKKQIEGDGKNKVYGVVVKPGTITAAADVVGKELPLGTTTFDMSATGTAFAYSVPSGEPRSAALGKLAQEAQQGFDIDPSGAIVDTVGAPTVDNEGVHWRVRARGAQFRRLDEQAIRGAVAGKSLSDVGPIVDGRGLRLVRVSTWPGWWPVLPLLDSRIRIESEAPASAASP